MAEFSICVLPISSSLTEYSVCMLHNFSFVCYRIFQVSGEPTVMSVTHNDGYKEALQLNTEHFKRALKPAFFYYVTFPIKIFTAGPITAPFFFFHTVLIFRLLLWKWHIFKTLFDPENCEIRYLNNCVSRILGLLL